MTDETWLTSLHESSHAVTAISLGGRCLGMALVDGGGLTQVDGLRHADHQAFVDAAGSIGEQLAKQFPAPSEPPAEQRLLSVDEIEALPLFKIAPRLACQMARPYRDRINTDSDERHLALWAIGGRESCPGEWRGRVEHAKRMAAEIVRRNTDAIVRVATALYVAGSLSETEILEIC